MTQQKITINEVASAAGVSVTTVSLVLSGKGRISSATVERVNQAITQLGYVRNRSAAALRGGSSGTIGVIVRDLSQRFYAELTAGLSEALEAQGKTVLLTQSGAHGQHLTRCFDSLIAQGVDAVVLGGDARNAAALAPGVPLICASRASYLEGADSLRPDNALGGRMATEFLLRQGHQHIAWLGGCGASLTRAERIGGYCATLIQHGLPFNPEWIIECDESPQAAGTAITRLQQRYPHLTAVIASSPPVALGCCLALLRREHALRQAAVDSNGVQPMALVGFSDELQANLTDPSLTFICNPARAIGRAAAARTLLRLSTPDAPVQHVIMPPQLIGSSGQ
ncbi:Mal regulon transcriptional regulator MalI [Pantoea sp. KPR_PJ]|uniref:Mal regulon transcriptional regulator MalI n=1 Tax=Pantoea sp. KPR_PJ TaxID=2738375 RepID=UPI003527D593